jgi:uncharacterized protein (TIGR02117 family)
MPSVLPVDPVDARPVWVVVHAYHAGLMVWAADVPSVSWPVRNDFPDAHYLEMGWGDRRYYTSQDPSIADALRAVLLPTDSAVHAVALFDAPQRTFPDSIFIRIEVSGAGFRRLVEFVRATHHFDGEGRAMVLASGQVPESSLFYASQRRFHLFETCNTWVARGLREAGQPVRPELAITSGALARQASAIAERQRSRAGVQEARERSERVAPREPGVPGRVGPSGA